MLLLMFVHATVASSLLTEASVEQTQGLLKSWGLHDFFGAKVGRLSSPLLNCNCCSPVIKKTYVQITACDMSLQFHDLSYDGRMLSVLVS